jgi:hypothetical protein
MPFGSGLVDSTADIIAEQPAGTVNRLARTGAPPISTDSSHLEQFE